MAQDDTRRLNWARLPLIATISRVLRREVTLESGHGRGVGAPWPHQYCGRVPTTGADCQEPQVALQIMVGRSDATSFRIVRPRYGRSQRKSGPVGPPEPSHATYFAFTSATHRKPMTFLRTVGTAPRFLR
jgi:hypothetical protein